MPQKFYAHPTNTFTWDNGAVGHRAVGPGQLGLDTLGPYAKVKNCPIRGTHLRLTCYATGHADSFFSIPACTRHRGKHIAGFFYLDDGNVVFVPAGRYRKDLPIVPDEVAS